MMKKSLIFATIAAYFSITFANAKEVYNFLDLNNGITANESFLNIDSDLIIREKINDINYDVTIAGNRHNFYGQGLVGGFTVGSAGSLILESLSFSYFSSETIGTFYNEGVSDIYLTTFSSNLSSEKGGVIKNMAGSFSIHDGNFYYNELLDVTGENSGGGAIYNAAILNIYNSQFIGNAINNSAINSGGGALFNAAGATTNIQAALFFANEIYSSGDYKKGGAIYNQGNMYIYNSGFVENVLTGEGENIVGAAIYNQSGIISFDNLSFLDNKANYGAAIYNEAGAVVNAYNSGFIRNEAQVAGGAIYNAGIFSIIVDDGISRFYSNDVVAGTEDAIYNIGTLNINAGSNSDRNGGAHSSTGFFDLRDDITGDVSSSGIININNEIKIDHDANPSTATISAPTSGIVFITGSIYNNNLNIFNGSLSFAHGTIDEHVSGGDFSKTGGNLWLDVDLEYKSEDDKPSIDTLHVDSVTGTPRISLFRVISDIAGTIGESVTLDVFTNANPTTITTGKTFTNTKEYTISANSDGEMTFELTRDGISGYDAARAINGTKSFSLTGDMQATATASLSFTYGDMTIFGNLTDAKAMSIDAAGDVVIASDNFKYGDNVYVIDGGGTKSFSRGNSDALNVVDTVIQNTYIDYYGAVIANNSDTINVMNSIFINNVVTHNGGAISSAGITNVFYSSFYKNSASSFGGAISNGEKTVSVYLSDFYLNTAGVGGAISTRGYLSVSESLFNQNKATSGGALYLYIQGGSVGVADINLSDFNDNIAKSLGGAIYNTGKLTLTNSSFKNNSSKLGGALYNEGVGAVVNLAAYSEAVLFSGNRDNVTTDSLWNSDYSSAVYNAIYNKAGTINMNAGAQHSIEFDDAITGENGIININDTTTLGDLVGGTLIFNNLVSGNTVNFYDGVLKFGTVNLGGTDYYGGIDNGSDLNLNGGTLSLINNIIGNSSLGKLSLNDDVFYQIDVDLEGLVADKIDAASVAIGGSDSPEFIINELNIIKGATSSADVKVLLSDNSAIQQAIRLDLNLKITQNPDIVNSYQAILYEKTDGYLTFSKMNLVETVNSGADTKIYTMGENESVTSNIGYMGGFELIIQGNGYNIISDDPTNTGMVITEGKEATIYNVGVISSFANSAIENNGTLNLYASTHDMLFDGNYLTGFEDAYVGVYNTETFTMEAKDGKSITFNDEVRGDGTGTIYINSDMASTGKIIFNNKFEDNDIVLNHGELEVNDVFDNSELRIDNSILTLGKDSVFTSTELNATGNVKINSVNEGINNISFDKLSLDGNIDLSLDVDLATPDADEISATNVDITSSSNINISKINIISDADEIPMEVEIVGNNLKNYITLNGVTVTKTLPAIEDYENGYFISYIKDIDSGNLRFEYSNLAYAITSLVDIKAYSFNTNATLSGDLVLGGSSLSLDGGGYTVSGGNSIDMDGGNLFINNATVNTLINVNGGELSLLDKTTISKPITGDGVLNINNNVASELVVLGGNMAGFSGTTNLNGGILKVGGDFMAGAFNVNSNPILDVTNSKIGTINTSSWTMNTGIDVIIDVDLENAIADGFENTTSLAHPINISGINLISEAPEAITVSVTNKTGAGNFTIDTALAKIETPIYIYEYTVDSSNLASNGDLIFNSSGVTTFAPESLESLVAKQAQQMSIMSIHKEVFANFDIDTLRYRNSIATGDDASNISNVWFRPFGRKEDVDLDKAPTIENLVYGALLGMDSKKYNYANGINGMYSTYAGFIGSDQSYDGVDIHQDGFALGARALFDKDDFFTGFTANIGTNYVTTEDKYGDDDYMMYSFGASMKSGVNIKSMNEKLTVQPSLMLSYAYGYTNSFTNAADVNIDENSVHFLQIAPGVKVSYELEHQMYAYSSLTYNWNLTSDSDVTADDIALPNVGVNPYTEFKVGLQNEFPNNILFFAEILTSFGGRKGIGGQIGIEYSF